MSLADYPASEAPRGKTSAVLYAPLLTAWWLMMAMLCYALVEGGLHFLRFLNDRWGWPAVAGLALAAVVGVYHAERQRVLRERAQERENMLMAMRLYWDWHCMNRGESVPKIIDHPPVREWLEEALHAWGTGTLTLRPGSSYPRHPFELMQRYMAWLENARSASVGIPDWDGI